MNTRLEDRTTAAANGTDASGTDTTGAAASGTDANGTGTAAAGTGGTEAVIGSARERIDSLDERIIALMQERMSVSESIQRARMASGGRRVALSREMEIISRYSEALGRPGTTVAMTLLELCRGQV
ncbi:hypothetical protein GCM10010406_47080 [Streptomyces thermolineatus]|uniref:Chorismate mutase domain-containing protein n=1 Tax=Streptomyces thermolineatus TaxID=44033 RepID=A0ABN3MMY6_9ACTN